MKKVLTLVLVLFTAVSFIIGCSKSENPSKKPELKTGELNYQVIDPSAQELQEEDLKKWYEENFRSAGLHTLTANGKLYLLVSAGEKPTGGYYLENLTLTGKENSIEVSAKLHAPSPDEIVTQALTYPHLLVCIPYDEREIVFKGIEGGNISAEEEIKKDSGKFMGQIDSNSIEVRISGVPEDLPPRAFQLSDEIKENFEQYNLELGDEILFSFIKTENGRPVIIELEKIKN